ncbi:DJ-1/PfpI family protein [Paraburkholderia azotifigens]|jgi:AraC family transcriptional regulator, transcriptional activator FtrA|uniref:DJ-1/PfpI family protein n=1 Tax=Paraburkholderia azotifigens TaxID=2057004 RepID=UPI0007E8D0A9
MDQASKVVDIAVLAYDGVDELDLFGAWSVLRKAMEVERKEAQPQLRITLAGQQPTVRGSGGILFDVTSPLASLANSRAVLIPGGRGARSAASNKMVVDALTDVLNRGGRLYCVCTGSLIAAATGLARASRLAIHRNKRELLLDFPVDDIRCGFVRDGQFVSIGGDLSPAVKSVDLAFAVLQDLAPYAIAPVAERMEVVPQRAYDANDADPAGRATQ